MSDELPVLFPADPPTPGARRDPDPEPFPPPWERGERRLLFAIVTTAALWLERRAYVPAQVRQ